MVAKRSRYDQFLDAKAQLGGDHGFDPVWMPDFLFPFQRDIVTWAVRRGRCAIFADCGLGKTPMQLVWCENVVRRENKPVLLVTTLGDAGQTVREASKFGVEVARSKDGRIPHGVKIVVTNYERLHHFNPDDFVGVSCNESSCLKDAKAKTREMVTEFLRTRKYRLLCTATAAPNDFHELGTSAEALGELGYQDMLSKFFKRESQKDQLGWGRTKHRLRAYAERDFWRWVCSWSRSCRRPSDLGYDDGPFVLPRLDIRQHEVVAARPRAGRLFDLPAENLQEQREEARRTIPERCGKAADLVRDTGKPAVCWGHLNDETDELTRLIPGAVQVSGSDSDDEKEEAFEAFSTGQVRVLITKPTIAAFGLNWQHCSHLTYFPSHSFEQWYQLVRRFYRFGQKSDVTADVITTEGGAAVLANLRRKAEQADEMFDNLVSLSNESLRIGRSSYGEVREEVPAWL